MANEQKADEEKAREISQSVSFFWTNEDDGEKSIIDTVSLRKAIFNAALQAMQWKDEQEIEFLQSLMFQASTQQSLNIIIKNRIKLLKGE